MSWKEIVEKYDLDVSIVNFSELENSLRLAPEFYNPKRIKYIQFLNKKTKTRISDYYTFPKKTLNPKLINEKRYVLELENIKNFQIKDVPLCDTKEILSIKNLAKKGDILISRLRPYLKQICISPLNNLLTTTEFVVITNNNIGDNIYLYFFLCSKYVQDILLWSQEGNEHPRVPQYVLENLPLVFPSAELIEKLQNLYLGIESKLQKAKSLYSQAEALLLTELGLSDYTPNEANISIRDLFECLQDDRFDAEYWMPKYDEIIEKIKGYKSGFSTIGKEFEQIKNNFKRQNDKEYNYIEIGDVNVSTGEVEYNAIIGKELPANAKIKFCKRQLITSKVRPNRGATAILNNYDGFIGSGAFTVLVEKGNINLETLMVYLKTEPIRELLLRYNTGTSYPVIIDNDILQLPIPLLDKNIQTKISELINTSSIAREQSKTLLEKAKRAVEIFIEQDEEKALEYLAS
jgi:type I restriction enzyme S subunit